MARGVLNAGIFADRYGGRAIDYHEFGEEHRARVNRYQEYWKFYKGDHWAYTRGTSDPDSSPLNTWNYCKRIIDIQVNFLMKKGFDIVIPDDPYTAEREDLDKRFVKRLLDDTWRFNKKPLICFELAQSGCVTGDAFVRVYWSDIDPLTPAHAKVEILPSHLVFPEYGSAEGIDFHSMRRCTVLMPTFEEIEKLTIAGRKKEKFMVVHREVWTSEVREVWKDDKLVSSTPNPFGEIPIVHIRNYPVVGESFGMSDLHSIIDIQKEINEKSTDISDVINYHGSPITIIKGAKISSLERGANRVWAVPETADVKNLELSGDLGAAHRYLEMLKAGLFDLAGIPQQAFGIQGPISGTSGVALAMQWQPLLETRQVKVQTYGYGIRMINRLIIMTASMKDKEFRRQFAGLDDRSKYFNEVRFPSPLPRDEGRFLEQAEKRLSLGLTTRRIELEAMGHGEIEIERILKESLQERKDLAQAEFEVGQFMPGAGPTPTGMPSPELQGDKVSAQMEEDADAEGV